MGEKSKVTVCLFDYQDYRLYLRDLLPVTGGKRGGRSALARAIDCRPAFVSQVLSSKSHLSLEQGIKVASYLGFSEKELDYFMALFQENRASSASLKKYFKSKKDLAKAEYSRITSRLKSRSPLQEKWITEYYSHWFYSAVHIGAMLPKLQTRAALAEKLQLPLKRVSETVDFLCSIGVLSESQGKLKVETPSLHISPESPLVRSHHTNWRLKAIESLSKDYGDDLHYCGVLSLPKGGAEKIRSLILKCIEDMEPVVQKTPEEEMHCVVLDLFGIVTKDSFELSN